MLRPRPRKWHRDTPYRSFGIEIDALLLLEQQIRRDSGAATGFRRNAEQFRTTFRCTKFFRETGAGPGWSGRRREQVVERGQAAAGQQAHGRNIENAARAVAAR